MGTPQTVVIDPNPNPSDTSAQEAAMEKVVLKELWRAVEVAKVEVNPLNNMIRRGLGVPQTESMVDKIEKNKKSATRCTRDVRLSKDLMSSKLRNAKKHLKEKEKERRNQILKIRKTLLRKTLMKIT